MSSEHLGELTLRRTLCGELKGGAEEAHAQACPQCRNRLKALEEERKAFLAQVPFDRFSAGVQLASRRELRRPMDPKLRFRYGLAAAAAAAVLFMVAGEQLRMTVERPLNRLKGGGAAVEWVVAAPQGVQRRTAPGVTEALASGEKVRIGYRPGNHRYLSSVSVDEAGAVTPLYPETGESLPTPSSSNTAYLPGSLEFTGRGQERVIVLLSDQPVQVSQVVEAAQKAYRAAGGEVSKVSRLGIPGEEFHQVLLKP